MLGLLMFLMQTDPPLYTPSLVLSSKGDGSLIFTLPKGFNKQRLKGIMESRPTVIKSDWKKMPSKELLGASTQSAPQSNQFESK